MGFSSLREIQFQSQDSPFFSVCYQWILPTINTDMYREWKYLSPTPKARSERPIAPVPKAMSDIGGERELSGTVERPRVKVTPLEDRGIEDTSVTRGVLEYLAIAAAAWVVDTGASYDVVPTGRRNRIGRNGIDNSRRHKHRER